MMSQTKAVISYAFIAVGGVMFVVRFTCLGVGIVCCYRWHKFFARPRKIPTNEEDEVTSLSETLL